jgi:twitching motility protein PilT
MGAAKSINRIFDAFPHDQQAQVRMQLATVLEAVVCQQLIPRADGKGLVLATEMMHVNSAIRNLIREGKAHQVTSVIQMSDAEGMHTMDSCLANLCNTGVITFEDAFARAQDLAAFSQLVRRR